jgi:phosphopantothenoylcysteine decarboxylase / phosphopantothenate---cysteine ligase
VQSRILLGVSGGIAAYKACELTRRLRDAGADVRVVMTENALRFVSATSFQALSANPVRTSLWDEHAEAAMGHIELARWAELILIAPASANTIAKLAHGIADDLLSTLALASSAPLALAPAMNQQMWAHPAVQANIALLRARGAQILGPGTGDQACGDVGPGRMWEVPDIVTAIVAPMQRPAPILVGKHVVITAGPTFEDLDPIRFIGNRSSGKMGFALAAAAQRFGARVSLIAGPCQLPTPFGVSRTDVRSAAQMLQATEQACADADVFIAAAAVADFRAAEVGSQKLKKNGAGLRLELVENPDIVAHIAAKRVAKRPIVVGFAAETENVLAHARSKLQRKGLDWIAANQVGFALGMDRDDNALVLISATQELDLGQGSKTALADKLLRAIFT